MWDTDLRDKKKESALSALDYLGIGSIEKFYDSCLWLCLEGVDKSLALSKCYDDGKAHIFKSQPARACK